MNETMHRTVNGTLNGTTHATMDDRRIDRTVAAGLALAGAAGLAWLAGMVYVIAAWTS